MANPLSEQEYLDFMAWFEKYQGSKFQGAFGGAGKIPKNTQDIYNDQYYRQYQSFLTQLNNSMLESQSSMYGMDLNTYWQLYQVDLEGNLNDKDITPEVYAQEKLKALEAIAKVASGGANPRTLPLWNENEDYFVKNYGEPVAGGKLIKAGNAYYKRYTDKTVMPVTDPKEIQSYFGTGDDSDVLAREKFNYQKMMDAQQLWGEQAQQKQQSVFDKLGYNQAMQSLRDKEAQMPELKAQEYERARWDILSQANQPVDWIKKWYAGNTPNPWRSENPLQARAFEGQNLIGQRQEQLQQQNQWQAGQGNPLKFNENSDWSFSPQDYNQFQAVVPKQGDGKDWYGEAVSSLAEAIRTYTPIIQEQQALAAASVVPGTSGAAGRIGTQSGVRQTSPNAPSWLSRYASNQWAGQPITKQEIATPSGQSWSAALPSEKEGLRGYVNWAGQDDWSDVMARMNQMLPGNPRGAGRESWRPIRQLA